MKLSHLLTTVSLFLVTANAHAAYPLGPGTQMPGVHPKVWTNICARADTITGVLAKLTPGATEQQKNCTNVFLKIKLLRLGAALDAARQAGPAVLVMSGSDAEGYRESRSAVVEVGSGKGGPSWFADNLDAQKSPTNSLDGAATKLLKEYREKCGDSGPGPGGPGLGASGVSAWTSEHPHWNTSPEYGPPLFPSEDPTPSALKALSSPETRRKVEQAYPGIGFDSMVARLRAGVSTFDDVERFHLVLGTTLSYFTYNARVGGMALINRAAAVSTFPVFILPPGYEKVPGRDSDPRQGL